MSERTMVERVARAICAVAKDEPDKLWALADMRPNVVGWQLYVDEAEAAIAAMREPTIAMRKVCTFEEAEVTWPAMIDAALAKATGGEG